MVLFQATATCDWGHIFFDRQVKASSFPVAFRRAAGMAWKEARRRPHKVTVTVTRIGKVV